MTTRVRIGIALALPFATVLAQLALWPVIDPYSWFLFYPTVFASSWLGGRRTGLVCTAISGALVWWYFIPPEHELVKADSKPLFALAAFTLMGVLFSISHGRLRAANEAVLGLLERTRELDELKSRFFANVSHELRTPLTLILGPVGKLLEDPDLSAEVHHRAEVVDRNARQLLRLVGDVLDASKIDIGRLEVRRSAADLGELVRRVTSQFDYLAAERHIDFVVQAATTVAVAIDRDKIDRAVTNLVANAFKFTPDGGRIRVTLFQDGTTAHLEVADSGPGVPVEHREAIFDRFHQIDSGDDRHAEGTGLGLTIAREFVLLHGGTIEIRDAPEGGALFRITLAVDTAFEGLPVPAPLDAVSAPDRPGLGSRTAAATPPDRPRDPTDRRPVVLVVEDNDDMRQFLHECLVDRYQVITASNGAAGLAAARSQVPSLIVSDVMMPGMSGDELLRSVRADPALTGVPVVMLTARHDVELRVELLRAGANDCMTKPFGVEELLARLDNLIRLALAERDREQARSHLYQLLHAAPDPTVVVDGTGTIVVVNRQAELAFGYRAADLLGQKVEVLLPESARTVHPDLRQRFARDPHTRPMGGGLDLRGRRSDGSEFPVDVSLAPIHMDDGDFVIAAVRDITDRIEVQRELRRMALHDTLTGLPNRVLLMDRIEHALAALERTHTVAALLFLDLDGFKGINDDLGHAVGDRVLAEVAQRIRDAVRPEDTVARLGGDEFVVVCSDLARGSEAMVVAERITESLRRPLEVDPDRSVSAAIGIALAARPGDRDAQALLRAADDAMYQAKARAPGSIAFAGHRVPPARATSPCPDPSPDPETSTGTEQVVGTDPS